MSYAAVAIPAQTQLQEDLPEDVRGRVFGVLNMLVSIASFLPIIIVGPVSDLVGTTTVLVIVGVVVTLAGVLSILRRGPIRPTEPHVDGSGPSQPLDPMAVAVGAGVDRRRAAVRGSGRDHATGRRRSRGPLDAG